MTPYNRHYHLRCLLTDAMIEDSNVFPLHNKHAPKAAFLRSEYHNKQFIVHTHHSGMFRFQNWLPVVEELEGSSAPLTYKSSALAKHLSLENLYITVSGYLPERGITMKTGTFKELEAYAVFGRMGKAAYEKPLVVASAGNTARAFIHVASLHNFPLVVIIPQKNIAELWTSVKRSTSTTVVAAGAGSDYSDAIQLASILAQSPEYRPEGGAKNIARRDGMATTFLSAAHAMGETPQHYFQAVGSGTGAIAAWEANIRLQEAGITRTLTKLHLAQNAPFQLLTDSWALQSRTLAALPENTAKEQIHTINAKVLANRKPPWSITGGLFDALTATNGKMYAVTNKEADEAGKLFETLEGFLPSPAACVACGALIQAVKSHALQNHDSIMLNITGGGYKRITRDLETYPLTADIIADKTFFSSDMLIQAVHNIRNTTKHGGTHE